MIQIVNLDQFFDQTRLEELVKRVPELELLRGGGVVMELGEGAAGRVRRGAEPGALPSRLAAAPRVGFDRFESAFTGEDEITSALIRMREGKKSKVAFTTGTRRAVDRRLESERPRHRQLESPADQGGLRGHRSELDSGCDSRGPQPADRGGTQEPVQARGTAQAQSVCHRGRPILLVLGNNESSGLEELLKSFNLEIGKGQLIDPSRMYNHNPAVAFAPLDGGNEAPDRRRDGYQPERCCLPNAAPIHVLGQGPNAGDQFGTGGSRDGSLSDRPQ